MKGERTIIREKEKREHPLFIRRFYKNIEGEGPNFQEYVKKKPITEAKTVMKCSLWYSTWMGKSEQGLCTSQCLAPGEEGGAFPGYLTQSLLPWVENRR